GDQDLAVQGTRRQAQGGPERSGKGSLTEVIWVERQTENAPAEPNFPVAGRRSEGGGLRVFAGIIAAIAVFSALYLARGIFAPVAAALFTIAIAWQLQHRLQAHIPKLMALAVVIVAIAVVLVTFTTTVAWSLGRVGRWLVADIERYQQLYE